MKTTKFSVSAIFAATAAALALSAASHAASPAASSTSAPVVQENSVSATQAEKSRSRGEHRFHKGDGQHHKHMKHGHHRHTDAGLRIPGYGPVSQQFVDKLGLTEQQSKLLEEARSSQKQLRAERGDGMKASFKAKREQIQQGAIDPRAALKQADDTHERLRAEQRQVDEKWLAVWESLDKSQQDKVVVRMNERAEKLAKRIEQRKERKELKERNAEKAPEKISS